MKAYATAREMLADLRAKKVSARELLNAHVARNAPLAKRLNAVVATDLARAERDARAIDDARARGEMLGPLADGQETGFIALHFDHARDSVQVNSEALGNLPGGVEI